MKPHRPDRNLLSTPGYYYHATNVDNALSIAADGKLKVHKPWEYTDQSEWPDGSTEKRVYFSARLATTWDFAPEDGVAVVLRSPAAATGAGFKRESVTGDYYITKPAAAKWLEMLDDNGNWVALIEAAR